MKLYGFLSAFSSVLLFSQAQGHAFRLPPPDLGVPIGPSPRNATSNPLVVPPHNVTTSQNATLATRQLGPSIWATRWYPGPKCNPDGTCSITSIDDIPHIKLNGQGYTLNGLVFVGIYRYPNNAYVLGQNIYARSYKGYKAGSWGLTTATIDCSSFDKKHVADSYAIAYDWTTHRFSPKLWLYTFCPVL